MATATATELELLVMAPMAMDDDAMGGDDNADMSDEEEPGDDELKDDEDGEDKDEMAAE
jgi:hypothetical protein